MYAETNPKTNKEYNGWANYESWNVNLWIANDPGLYELARGCSDYDTFVGMLRVMLGEAVGDGGAAAIGYETPDGVAWSDSGIDVEEINRVTFGEEE